MFLDFSRVLNVWSFFCVYTLTKHGFLTNIRVHMQGPIYIINRLINGRCKNIASGSFFSFFHYIQKKLKI